MQSDSITTIADVFKTMPDSLLPYLTQNDKLDLLDFNASGMKAKVTNKFNDQTTLDSLSSNYLRLTLSRFSVMEMNLLNAERTLPDSASHIIKTTLTLGNQHQSKIVKIYTAKWKPLK